MAAPPLKIEVSDVFPNPSNAVMRTGMGKFWDFAVERLRSCVADGTANAITGTFDAAAPVTTLTNGLTVLARAASANTSTTPTFKADGTAAKTIVKGSNSALIPGDIAGAGHWLLLAFDATLDKWILQNPINRESYIYIRDEKAAGMNGGSAVAGFQTRTLNTEVTDAGGLATLASNQIALAPGTYRVFARAPAFGVNGHKIRLRNVTAGTTLLTGSTSYSSNTTAAAVVDATLRGQITVAAGQALELQHYCQLAQATTGLGGTTNVGEAEVFAEIEFWKED